MRVRFRWCMILLQGGYVRGLLRRNASSVTLRSLKRGSPVEFRLPSLLRRRFFESILTMRQQFIFKNLPMIIIAIHSESFNRKLMSNCAFYDCWDERDIKNPDLTLVRLLGGGRLLFLQSSRGGLPFESPSQSERDEFPTFYVVTPIQKRPILKSCGLLFILHFFRSS